ncbi:hypothetical protein ACSBM8_11255 [Sphingomonas sp. ASY06-1R]|jgi:hypothetical protein|uniref:hypothetical protein n=1 Tax=Sphingomonas sp. ASY06-1R TaxID=3445771 RepID=UPI003FA30387
MTEPAKPWDGALVRKWLDRRVVAARLDQVAAERAGRAAQDDCDKASAEEMICTALQAPAATDAQDGFVAQLKALLDRDHYIWRGIYDDVRFDRHARTYVRKLMKMAKANNGFATTNRYQ